MSESKLTCRSLDAPWMEDAPVFEVDFSLGTITEVEPNNSPRAEQAVGDRESATVAEFGDQKQYEGQPPSPRHESPSLTVQEAAAYCRLAVGTLYNHRREIQRMPGTSKKLHRIKGPTWLWECTVAESKEHRPATRTHAQTDFQPGTWRWTIQNIFREFNEGKEKKAKVRPHDLRARAITLVAATTQSVDATAEALGLDAQTALHYLDCATAFKGTELLQKLAGGLLPEKTPEAAAG